MGSKEYSCSGHGLCNPQGHVLCMCSPGWSGLGTFSKTFCAFEVALNESNVKKSADSDFSIVWLALIVSLPTAAFMGLCFVWLYLFRPKRNQLVSLRSSLLDPILKSGKQKQDIFCSSVVPHKDRSTMARSLLEPEVCYFPTMCSDFICVLKPLLPCLLIMITSLVPS